MFSFIPHFHPLTNSIFTMRIAYCAFSFCDCGRLKRSRSCGVILTYFREDQRFVSVCDKYMGSKKPYFTDGPKRIHDKMNLKNSVSKT